jgi:hypothetical protein
LQALAEHQDDLGLQLRGDEPLERDGVAVAVGGGREDRAVVGGVDADQLLHRRRGEPDLVPHDPVAVGEQQRNQLLLDRVAVGHGQVRLGVGERGDRHARSPGLVERLGLRLRIGHGHGVSGVVGASFAPSWWAQAPPYTRIVPLSEMPMRHRKVERMR